MQDLFDDFEDLEPTEETSDFALNSESFSDLVIAPADWTINTLYSLIGKQIDLDPDFQRRNVWARHAKSRFIESLFLGIPIPQILLSSKPNQKNSFLVLDGKQRLLTIKEFLEDDLKLQGLRVLKEIEGCKWSDLINDPQWADRFLNETQRTAVIRNWRSEKVLYEIFFRLNSGSVKLSPMELRMSLHPGKFLSYVIDWTETISPLHELLSKKVADPRMNDVELAVRFLGFHRREVTYRGDLKSFLDETSITLNDLFERNAVAEASVKKQLGEMLEAISAGMQIFKPKQFCRKVVRGVFENRFNRAVFDVQVGALTDSTLRQAAKSSPDRFLSAYLEASKDDRFVNSVETSTKTTEATRIRFSVFYDAIFSEFGIRLQVPDIQ